MKLKNNLFKLSLLCFAMTICFVAFEQPPGGPPPGGGTTTPGTPPCWTPPCVPIDGGVAFLIAAGAILGIRKLYKPQVG